VQPVSWSLATALGACLLLYALHAGTEVTMFEFFDRKEEFVTRHGNLPHWYQPGVAFTATSISV
jgi:hypothetical protein